MKLLLEAFTYYRGSDEPLSVVVILVVRVALVVTTGWLIARALSRSSAAVQHRVWLLAVLGTLVVPMLWALTPRWRLPLLAVHVQGTPAKLGSAAVTAESIWPELLVVVWITGVVLGLAYVVLGIVSARRLFAASMPCRDGAWLAALALVKRETGVTRRVELRMTKCSMSPAVWSFRRVRILVPADSLAWPLELRRSVLLHELAHVTRRDCAGQVIVNLACAVWWFHPLVWYAADRVRGLAEQAADDSVIRAGRRRADYAEGLLRIASTLGWQRAPSVAQSMFHPSHLERRLRAILDPDRQRNAVDGRVSAASLLIGCVLMILLATLTSSVVRAVQPQSDTGSQREQIDAPHAASPIERGLTHYQPGLTFIPVKLAEINREPPPVTFQLIPNWEMHGHAEMLIPNYQSGMGEIRLVEAQVIELNPSAGLSADHAARVLQHARRQLAMQHQASAAAAPPSVASEPVDTLPAAAGARPTAASER